MKDHSRGRGKRGVGYRTPSLFRAGIQKHVRDQQLRGGGRRQDRRRGK